MVIARGLTAMGISRAGREVRGGDYGHIAGDESWKTDGAGLTAVGGVSPLLGTGL